MPWDSRFHVNSKRGSSQKLGRSQSIRGREKGGVVVDVPSLEISEGAQSSKELVTEAASLLGARRRIEAEIKIASDKGDYSAVVQLVKQRDTLNQLLKDVFAFADGNLNIDAANEHNTNRAAKGQWWLDETKGDGDQDPQARRNNNGNRESKAHTPDPNAQTVRNVNKDRTFVQPAVKAKTRRSNQEARPTSAPSRRLGGSNQRGRGQKTAKRATLGSTYRKTFTDGRYRVKQSLGMLANANGFDQQAVTKVVHVPTLKPRYPGKPRIQRKQPGPGQYNIKSQIGGGGFSMGAGAGRSRVALKTDGGPADYDIREKLGKRGYGFGNADQNLRLWYYRGCWCLGLSKHMRQTKTRGFCALFVETEERNPTRIGEAWSAHLGRKKTRPFGDPEMHPETYGTIGGVRITSKYKGKKTRSSAPSYYSPKKGNNSNKIPPLLLVSGIAGFHNRYNGQYVRDATAGLISGRPVWRRARGLEGMAPKMPGPGEYDLIKTKAMGTDGKRAVFAGRHSPNSASDTPGPNTYDTRNSPIPNNGVSFGVGERNKARRSTSPGPGAYEAGGPKGNKPAPRMSGKSYQRVPLRDNGIPGPGQYLRHSYPDYPHPDLVE